MNRTEGAAGTSAIRRQERQRALGPMEGERNACALLSAFQVASLGDGDASAGANQLAAMAVTLANLARPGSGIVTPEGRLYEVGCNLLATGPLLTRMILEEVVTPVRRSQDNLLAQLARLREDNEAEESRAPNRRWKLSDGPRPGRGESALFRLMSGDPGITPLFGKPGDDWMDVVSDAPCERFEDLVRCPRAFIAAPTLQFLQQQLPHAHLGQPLVAIGLNTASDARKFGDLCPALIDGLLSVGPSGRTIRGRLLVTDGDGVLHGAAIAAKDSTTWLSRLLWLTQGNAGPDFPTGVGSEGVVVLPDVNARYERAARLLFVNRLESSKPEPAISECDLAGVQAKWMSFLAGVERSLPGITGTARRLLASLIFGLRRLVGAAKPPEGFRYRLRDVEAFARILVHRMANARAALLFSSEESHRLKHRRRIFDKLAAGGLDTRSIYHPLHLDADFCRELLTDLEADQYVRRNGPIWEQIEGATLPADPSRRLQLEV